jgi:hypothetical protein
MAITINERHLAIALESGDARQIARIVYLAVLGLTIEASEKLIALAADCATAEEFQARSEADEIMSTLTRAIMELMIGPQQKEET